MAEHGLQAQVALVCETPARRRAELLAVAPEPERLIPALPPAELCFTALAVGLDDAGWILEHAGAEQMTACVDLDAWHQGLPDRARLGGWLVAFADAGEEALLRAARAVDFEAWTLHLMDRIEVVLKPSGDEDWTPPTGGLTLDGQFYALPRKEGDDLEELTDLLRVLFQKDYWFYFRLLQSVVWELPSETEEWARRWRGGRLEDLGFPPLGEAKALYSFMGDHELRALPSEERPWRLSEWPLPVWMPNLPASTEADSALFRAFAVLPEGDRRPFLLEFLTVANRLAVADDLPLGEAETLPTALAKAARFASLGIEYLSAEHGESAATILLRVSQERLFQVGFNLERAAGRAEPPPLPPDPEEEAAAEATDEE